MALYELPSPPLTGGGIAKAVGVGVLAGLALWFAAYAAGIMPWLGYQSYTRSSIGVGPKYFVVGENRSGGGFGIGPSTFLYFAGQKIVVSYDAEIRRGCLWLQVWHLLDQGPRENVSECVTKSGKGEWTVPVDKTGLYTLIIDSSLIKGAGPGWDMTYRLWWGARW
jgi:hypothetical protein